MEKTDRKFYQIAS